MARLAGAQSLNGGGITRTPALPMRRTGLYNIGNNNPVELLKFIEEIENALGRQAQKEFRRSSTR